MRANGLRLTRARKAFIETLISSRAPLSVPDILEAFGKIGVKADKTTVYRELLRLERLGIVESVQLGDRKRYYELAHRDHHHHLVCVECEMVEDIDVDERELVSQERKASREKGFAILRHSLEFFGLCRNCQP